MTMFRMIAKGLRSTIIAILAIFLFGCTVGPDYRKPETNSPKNWISSQHHQGLTAKDIHEQAWWRSFNDPVLNQLIAKAVQGNFDLKSAEWRISEARALYNLGMAALLPMGDMMGSVNRQKNQIAFPTGGSPTIADLVKQPFNVFKFGFDASWELDLFGGHRRDAESALADQEASVASFDEMMIVLLAEIAHTYVDIRLYQTQLNLAQNVFAIDEKAIGIVKQRFEAGGSPGMEVARAEAQQAQSQEQIHYFRNLLAQSEYKMDVLLGEQPGVSHDIIVFADASVPVVDMKLILAAPAAVIANRPDIRKAERKLAVATAQQGVAIAKFFPDVSLAGFIGLFNTNAANLLSISSASWSMGANVLWPILSYGSLSANLDAADARQQQALAKYQQTIISALSDVERSFTAYTEQEKHRQAREKATAAVRHVHEIAQERYRQGLTSFMEVLDAERNLHASNNLLIMAAAKTTQNIIAVYKSLGGGWKQEAL